MPFLLLDVAFAHDLDPQAIAMGRFLQKTNIIRDYLEDIVEGRTFWPKEIWSCYAPTLASFKHPNHRQQAVFCLNHMITDALSHVPDCLEYMRRLKNPSNFRFCAIPQVMAISTLELCYDNPDVFTGVMKIRKGLSAKVTLV